MRTPFAAGYTLAADWMPLGRVWMAWPCESGDWGDRLESVQETFVSAAQDLSKYYPVTMVANPQDVVTSSLRCGRGVGVVGVPHYDCSMRSLGLGFLADRSGDVAAVRFGAEENALTEWAEDHLDMAIFSGVLALEDGAIDVDGEGTCLASEDYFADLDKTEVERHLGDLGITKVIWLSGHIQGDSSGGHVTNMACFLAPGVVAVSTEADVNERNYVALQANLEHLRAERDTTGRALEVVELPQPSARNREWGGTPMALSYTCLFAGDQVVLVPAFEDPNDQVAYDRIVAALPDRHVISLPALDLSYGGMGLHAMAMPEPKAVILAAAASC